MSSRGSDVQKSSKNKGRVNGKEGKYATHLNTHPPPIRPCRKFRNLASDMALHKEKQNYAVEEILNKKPRDLLWLLVHHGWTSRTLCCVE